MNTLERIQRVRDTRPLVADLARALSLAANIDVALVRTMRRVLFDRADVTTEADLWTSPLIQTRSSGAITLRTDVRAALWDELRADQTELERCWAALEQAQPPGRPLRALEERLTYLAIKDDRAGIERELGTVVKAMLDDSARRRDLSAWSARALAELPEMVRDAEAARVLGTAAAGWVATPPSLANLARTPESVRLVHRLRAADKRTRMEIRRVGGVLEIGGSLPPPSVRIDIPTANSVLILDEDTTYRIDLRGLTRIPVTGPQVMIGTSDGRRWLLGPEQPRPNLDAVGLMYVGEGLGCAYLIAPSLAVSSARHLLRHEEGLSSIHFGSTAFEARTVGLDEDADIALLELRSPAPTSPLELQPDVRPGEAWKAYPLSAWSEDGSREPWSGTVARAWPDVTLRSSIAELPQQLTSPGMPIFVGDKIIAHLGGEPRRDNVLHATSARLIQGLVAKLMASRDQPILDIVLKANAHDSLDEIETRLQALSEQVVVRVMHAEVGEVTEHDVELARALNASIFGFVIKASAGATRRARDENVRLSLHDDIDRLIKAVHAESTWAPRRPVRRAAQRKRSVQRLVPQAAPVWIHLPERISTAGLLGSILEKDGRLQRIHAYRWGHHEVTIVTDPDPRPAEPGTLRVSIKDRLSETVGREFSVTTSGRWPEKQVFLDACRLALSSFWGGTAEPSHLPFGWDLDLFDIEIAVERLSHQAAAHAYRRGMQFLIEVLAQMDSLARARGGEPRQRRRSESHLTIAGSGKLDLGAAQFRVQRVSGDDELVLLWIDPETDLVTIKHHDGGVDDVTAIHTRVARALDGELGRRYVFDRSLDPIVGRFGISETRSGRKISARYQPGTTVVTVEADDEERIDRPVRGYVVFYAWTDEATSYSRRIRASGGVATCELPIYVPGYAVGAIIEDEGIMLEIYIDADEAEPTEEDQLP